MDARRFLAAVLLLCLVPPAVADDFIQAAADGDLAAVKAAVAEDAGLVGEIDALHEAAEYGHLPVVRFLLERGADPDAETVAVILVHTAGDPEIVKELLKHRPDLSVRDDTADQSDQTPLERAAYEFARAESAGEGEDAAKWKEIAMLLLKAGAEYDLNSAIYLGDLPRVRELLEKNPDRAGGGKEFWVPGVRPLEAAASSGRAEVVRLLLDRGVNPDWGYGPNEHNPELAKSGYPVVISALGHPEVVQVLIRRGADVKSPVEWLGGRSGIWVIEEPASLMHFAAEYDVVESATLLLEAGVPIDGTDADRQTPLHVAAIFGRTAMTRFLLERGTDWTKKDARGRTALEVAEAREKSWWTAMADDPFGDAPDWELLRVRNLLRKARGPVEAVKR